MNNRMNNYVGIFSKDQYEQWRAGKKFTLLSRDGKEKGDIKNPAYMPCRMTCCKGMRLRVIWPDGKETRPCSEGIKQISDDTFQIM